MEQVFCKSEQFVTCIPTYFEAIPINGDVAEWSKALPC